jgi:hypothetical protein
VDWNSFRLGLSDLPGRTPNPVAMAQTIRVFGRPETGSDMFVGDLLKGVEQNTIIRFLQSRINGGSLEEFRG